MEVAGQWRREWAGTAEYGKVSEGGVTRQVARAMEVLHASAPGARVRVLRAAYHSTAGPGAPASSYLLHSSRRVISSGYNFIEPDTSPSKPLEISSTPLESSPEKEVGTHCYKVTEPDDFEISEPSKWRGSKNINSLRLPSEESSSTDNTSVVDLDSNNKNTARKSTDRFILQNVNKRTSPISSLLDAPVTLSTLKYKSLLNGSDWNNRRKSYSFEETPNFVESVSRESDALTMESSTDSGISKSTEVVNDSVNFENSRYIEKKWKMDDIHEETFKDWLSRNRQKPFVHQVKTNKEHIIGVERIDESNITLQSTGKVSITLPTTVKQDDVMRQPFINNSRVNDSDRRTKKVEFCKTELHFTAESGTVNIIATDEKPPPTNDFKKRRNVFVPLTDYITDKSIILLGDKVDDFEVNKTENTFLLNEVKTDENTAATKSILKNKIPKPKSYLLGENMVLGDSNDLTDTNDFSSNFSKSTGVSLINRQLQPKERFSVEDMTRRNETDWSSLQKSTIRTTKIGSVNTMNFNQDKEPSFPKDPIHQTNKDLRNTIQTKVNMLQMSPTPVRAKTRQLRESDLTYFGIVKPGGIQNEMRKHSLDSTYNKSNRNEEILHSVRLVKRISNSVGNSEADSDEAPDYENLPIKYNFMPKPAPRSHSKYDIEFEGNRELRELKPILEKDLDIATVQTRRTRLKKEIITAMNRSISEPPKVDRSRQKSIETSSKTGRTNNIEGSILSRDSPVQKVKISQRKVPERKSESPLYVNLQKRPTKKHATKEYINGRSIQAKKSEKQCVKKNYHSRLAEDSECKSNSKTVNDYTRAKTGEKQSTEKNDHSSFAEASEYNSNPKKEIDYIQARKSEKRCTEKKKQSRLLDATECKSNRKTDNDRSLTVIRKESERQKIGEQNSERKRNTDHRTKILVTPEKSPSKSSDTHKKIRNADTTSFREKNFRSTSQGHHYSKTESKTDIQDAIGDGKKIHNRRDSKENEISTLQADNKVQINNAKSHHKVSTDTTSTKESLHDTRAKSTHNEGLKLSQSKVNISEKYENTQNASKRNKYVINYDDKNGTVSSICKIKPGHRSSRKKTIVDYATKENIKIHTPKMSHMTNKNDLTSRTTQDGYPKIKSKIYAHQSCQIL